ncbi:MAG: hypothetical protein K8U03_05690 [Planctomycetia bacterium]|nr:hypothetical protein [Planctomycetia bacterium]
MTANVLQIAGDIRGDREDVLREIRQTEYPTRDHWFGLLPPAMRAAWSEMPEESKIAAYAVACHVMPWLDQFQD